MENFFFKETPVNIPALIYAIRKFDGTDKDINAICDVLDNLCKALDKQRQILSQQQQKIDDLYNIIDLIAPDMDIIETMAESDEEKQEYINKYMNHGDYLK